MADDETPSAQPTEHSTEVAVRDQLPTTPVNLSGLSLREIAYFGRMFAASGMFKKDGIDSAEKMGQAVVKIVGGAELGLTPIVAMTQLNMVKGKLELSARVQGALVRRSGLYKWRVIERGYERCRLEFFERERLPIGFSEWESVGEIEFTIDDAKRGRVYSVDPNSAWQSWPREMLFARALTLGIRTFWPDVFAGATLYDTGEIQDGMPDFEVDPATVVEVPDADDAADRAEQPTEPLRAPDATPTPPPPVAEAAPPEATVPLLSPSRRGALVRLGRAKGYVASEIEERLGAPLERIPAADFEAVKKLIGSWPDAPGAAGDDELGM